MYVCMYTCTCVLKWKMKSHLYMYSVFFTCYDHLSFHSCYWPFINACRLKWKNTTKLGEKINESPPKGIKEVPCRLGSNLDSGREHGYITELWTASMTECWGTCNLRGSRPVKREAIYHWQFRQLTSWDPRICHYFLLPQTQYNSGRVTVTEGY